MGVAGLWFKMSCCSQFFMVAVLTIFQASTIVGENTCISNYGELKEAILNNTENKEDLLRGFYPPNQSPSHILTVYYYLQPHFNSSYPDEFNTTNASYVFQWVDSSTLLLLEWRLFNALSFDISQLTENNITLIISPTFCDKDEEVELLNMATIWVCCNVCLFYYFLLSVFHYFCSYNHKFVLLLSTFCFIFQLKSYAVGNLETDHYYSLYFDEDKGMFVVLGNDVRGTTYALIICEYMAAFGAMVALYTLLLVSRFKVFSGISKVFSDLSTSCFVLLIVMIIKDLISYRESYDSSSSTWYYTFPLPVVIPVWSVVNLVLSILVVIFIGKEFPLPGLLRFFYNHCCHKSKYVKGCLQVILVFSIAGVVLLVAFHFVWILLAFSAYPVRSIASQAFTIPLLVGMLTIFFLVDTVSSAPGLRLREAQSRLKRIGFSVVLSLMGIPIIIGLFGTLYFYSQALVKVNETENNPIKTVIAGLAPTIVAALLAWFTRKTLLYFDTNKDNDDTSLRRHYKRKSKNLEEINDLIASDIHDEIKLDSENEELTPLI